MTDRLRRRLAALETQRSPDAGRFILVPNWVTREEWDAYVEARLAEMPPGPGVVVIPEKGRASVEIGHG